MKVKRIFFLLAVLFFINRFSAQGAEVSKTALSYNDCLSLSLNNNVEVFLARARTGQAHGEKISARGRLLPQIDLRAFQRRVKGENYGAGTVEIFENYDFFDARVLVSQRILDLSALAEAAAGNIKWKKARMEEALVKEEVITATAAAYIEVLRVEAQLKAAQESITLAEHFVSLADHQLNVGVGSQIDLARAKTELARQKARYQDLDLAVYRAKMELKRIIKLPLGQDISLSDSLAMDGESWPDMEKALQMAWRDRLEMRVAKAQVDYSRQVLNAVKRERLPSIELNGEYGVSGLTPDKDKNGSVGYAGIQVSMPVWEGASIQGKIESQTKAKQEDEIRLSDLRLKIEEDVRLAYKTIEATRTQVKSRKEVVDLAKRELSLAENRFKTGVGDNIDVINAQTVLADARDAYVQALGQYEQASLNLYGALGNSGEFSLHND